MTDRLVLITVFAWFAIGGCAHFLFTETEMRIVPPWLPAPRALVLISGAIEWIGAVGLLFRPTRRPAAWMLFALTLAVTPANVYMLQEAAQFPSVPSWALAMRLPLQGLLLFALWRVARGRTTERVI